MTKERFVELMQTIEARYRKQMSFISMMNDFCSDNFIDNYFESDFLISYLDFIEEILTGRKVESDGFLIGCVIECDCDFNKMDFFDDEDDNNERVPSNWEDVYNFLTSIKINN